MKQFLDTVYVRSVEHYDETEKFILIIHVNKEGNGALGRVFMDISGVLLQK